VKKVHTVGLILTLVLVFALVGSLIAGLRPTEVVAGEQPRIRGADVVRSGRVEVLNAAGQPGWARAGTLVLRQKGFDVVSFGNARAFDRDSSVVLARTPDRGVADAVAAALGIDLVRVEPDSTLFVDATVVLGLDWSANGVPLPWRTQKQD
jgi:hypothetical protein